MAINYLFPPDQILKLPTWRFVLHFIAPNDYSEATLMRAIGELKAAEWKIITFPFGLDTLEFDAANKSVSVPIEVPEHLRERSNSLPDYESDVWKVIGNMIGCGFGDLYYEAVDWKE